MSREVPITPAVYAAAIDLLRGWLGPTTDSEALTRLQRERTQQWIKEFDRQQMAKGDAQAAHEGAQTFQRTEAGEQA